MAASRAPAAASRADSAHAARRELPSRVASHRVRLRVRERGVRVLGRGARLAACALASAASARSTSDSARSRPRSPPERGSRASTTEDAASRVPQRGAGATARSSASASRASRTASGGREGGDVRGRNTDSSRAASAATRPRGAARSDASTGRRGDDRAGTRRRQSSSRRRTTRPGRGRATFEKAARGACVAPRSERATVGRMAMVGVRGVRRASRRAGSVCGDRSRTGTARHLARAHAAVGRRFEIASADRAGEETVAFSPHTRVFRPPPVARGSSAISSSRGAGSVTKPKRGSLASRARSPPGRAARRRHISGRAPPTSSRTPGGYRISRASRDVRADPRLQPALQGAAALPRRRGTSRIAFPRDRKKSVPSAAFDRSRWRSVPPARVALAPSFSRRTRRPVRVPLAPRAARLLRPPWSARSRPSRDGTPPLPSSPRARPSLSTFRTTSCTRRTTTRA